MANTSFEAKSLPPDRPLWALFYMLLAQACFSLNILLIRLSEAWERSYGDSSFTMSAWEPMLYRSIALSVWCLWRLRRSGFAPMSTRDRNWLWARGLVGVASLSAYYHAVLHIPLGLASLFSNSSPFYVALLAVIVSGEIMSGMAVFALFMGFCGVGMVAWGAFAHAGDYAAFDLAVAASSGLFSALAYFSIRQLKSVRNEQIMLSLGVFGGIVSTAMIAWNGAKIPAEWQAHGLLLASVLPAVLAQEFLTRAFRFAPASQVSPLQYMGPVFSVLLGFLVLQERLPPLTLAGIAVVITFGLVFPYVQAMRQQSLLNK